MYSARDQSRAAGGSLRPDLLRGSGASCCNPVDSGEPASFSLPSSFEKNLATSHLSLSTVPRDTTVPSEDNSIDWPQFFNIRYVSRRSIEVGSAGRITAGASGD